MLHPQRRGRDYLRRDPVRPVEGGAETIVLIELHLREPLLVILLSLPKGGFREDHPLFLETVSDVLDQLAIRVEFVSLSTELLQVALLSTSDLGKVLELIEDQVGPYLQHDDIWLDQVKGLVQVFLLEIFKVSAHKDHIGCSMLGFLVELDVGDVASSVLFEEHLIDLPL